MADELKPQARQRSRMRAVATLAVAGVIVFASFLAGLVYDPPKISIAERRYLKTAPELSVKGIMAKEYMKRYEEYLADSFFGRDGLRALKAFAVLGLFRMGDNGGLYLDGNVGAGRIARTSPEALRQSAQKLAKAASSSFLEGCRIYFALIPDKGQYASTALPGIDMQEAIRIIQEEMAEGVSFIDLSDSMAGDMFYRGDLHWDQSRIDPVVRQLASHMGFFYSPDSFSGEILGLFRGVYCGQLAYGVPEDTMSVRVPDFEVKVFYLNEKTLEFGEGELYDRDALEGIDPYSVFLSGPCAIARIENVNASGNRTLVLIRDSFGSSIAPLLAGSYCQIVLVDLRYVSLALLPELIEIPSGSDVLFLFSTQILGSPEVLLVH